MSNPDEIGEKGWGDPPYKNAFLMEHKRDYVIKPKHYAQQDEKKCIICNIISEDETTTAYVIYKGTTMIAFLNLFPYTTAHMLLSPLRHIEGYDEMTNEELEEFAILSKRIIQMLKHYAHTESFNAGWNQGEWSGGSIRHFHSHFVPRYRTDINFIDIIGKSRTVLQSLEVVEQELLKYTDFLSGEKTLEEMFSN